MAHGSQTEQKPEKKDRLEEVVIRLAGDSGDGMQLTGNQFTNTSALLGNDLATFPDYPAEIRAPAGSLPGVSGFQVRFSSKDIHTPGDAPDAMVVMNPAAFKTNVEDLKPGGLLIVNTGNFSESDLKKAKYDHNPLEDDSLRERFRVLELNLNQATLDAVEGSGLTSKNALRCKNFLALGILYWVYSRPLEPTEKWIGEKFAKRPEIVEANRMALRAGHKIADNSELLQVQYEVLPADLPAGTYRTVMGNSSLAMGLVAAGRLSGLTPFYGSYPITPASDLLHALSRYKNHGVITFQAEDEIAAITSAIGASYAGCIGMTGTSGPGLALKTEALGLAVSVELPLVVVNVQRAGPSTGMPTKTEQADLLFAIFGRNSEAPLPVLAPSTPTDCFWTGIEAVRIAVTYMTPVLILSDLALANGAEPFRVPDVADLEPFPIQHQAKNGSGFDPFSRNSETLARPWAVPGTIGLEHRIGGLEKAEDSGDVSYDPENHERMVELREKKVMAIADAYPATEVYGPESGDLVVLGWGSTYGSIRGAVDRCLAEGKQVAQVHIRNLWPLPKDLGEILSRYEKVLIPEMNRGHLARLIRSEFLLDSISLSKVQGRPFPTSEIATRIEEILS
ncbi:MAG TPA: 2-oxoglutarate ferredoxin oxidoreductase subunit alpha [Planctomycetes bacterium]|nr:2-oxoglutarate ferredoxin oxidoreductase subunit alpha [Planctomycetota bacterium]